MSVEKREPRNTQPLTFGDFTLDRSDERLRGPRGPVKLGNKAYRLLLELVEQDGRLVTKEELFDSVWDGTIVSESALTSAMKELRRALGEESRTPRYIESVYGRGYRFIAPVTVGEAPSPQSPPAPPAAPARSAETAPRPASQVGEPALLYIPPIGDETVRAEHPHLAFVLREEILFALSRFRDIRLVSDVELNAVPSAAAAGDRDYQLSLNLLQIGGTIRAFARLSRIASQSIVWAETLNLPEGNLGQCIEQLVRSIAAAALPRLHDDVLRNLPEQPSDVFDLYFRNKLRMRSLGSVAEGRAVAADWERLIEQNPSFVQAYPPLIRLYNTDFGYTGLGSSGPAERSRAYELARRALALEATESHLHTVMGWCHLWAGEAALARLHFDQALDLNPWNKARLIEIATALMFLGELDRAGELLERCRNLTSFATESPYEEEGLLALLRGEFDAASARLTLATRTHPDDSAGGGPTVMSELYALLAAAGASSAELPSRAERWRQRMRDCWAGAEPLDSERLKQWALYHNPVQPGSHRERILALLETALGGAGLPAPPRTPGRERAETPC